MIHIFRKHQKYVMLVVAILTIVAFAWLYNPAKTSEFGANVAAQVYGKNLTQADIDREVRHYQLALALGQYDLLGALGGMGEDENASVSEFVWNLLVAKKQAEMLGINPTSEQVAAEIVKIPLFQTDGKFDLAKFQQFGTEQLGPRGLSQEQLEGVIRDSLRVARLQQIIGAPAVLGKGEIEQALRVFQPIELQVVRFSLENALASVTVDEAELKAYFERNQAAFNSPEQVSVEFVKFALPEGAPTEGRQRVEALQVQAGKATEFVESVNGENTFEKAATAAQLPILRAENIEKGNLASYGDLPQEAVQAAFLLSEGQNVSDVIQAGDAFYVVNLIKHAASAPLSFDQAKAQVENLVKLSKAEAAVKKQAEDALPRILDAVKGGSSFADAALAAGLKAESFSGVLPVQPNVPPEIFPAVRVALFLDPGQVSNFQAAPWGGFITSVATRAAVDQNAIPAQQSEIERELLDSKKQLIFASWLSAARDEAKISFPRRHQ